MDCMVEVNRNKYSANIYTAAFFVIPKSKGDRPLLFLEMSHNSMINRIKRIVSEFGINIVEICFKREHENMCSDCSNQRIDPCGDNYCIKSGLHVTSEQVCNYEDYRGISQYVMKYIYFDSFWNEVIKNGNNNR